MAGRRRGRGGGKPRRRRGARGKRRHGPRRWLSRIPWWGILWRSTVVAAVLVLAFVVYLDVTVRGRFEGPRWDLPAHVYSRPLELYQGAPLAPERLVSELDALGYRAVAEPDRPGEYVAAGNEVEVYARRFRFWDAEQPPSRFRVRMARGSVESLQVLAPRGARAPLRLEPLLLGSISPFRHEDRTLLTLDAAPAHLAEALIAIEDRRFDSHLGIDLRGMARAALANLRAGEVVEGGSTITQQLAKNFYLSAERTWRRKITEMVMALLLELHYDKQQILETYLNEVYLGQAGNRAIHGFGLASRFYFARPAEELNLPEVAMLAGLVRGPSYYDPRRHPERALARRRLVLDAMAEEGYITPVQAEQAARAPLGVVRQTARTRGRYPAFLDLVRRQLRTDYHERDLRVEGLRVFTTLDPAVQRAVEESAAATLDELERSRPGADRLQAAVVVVRPDDGEVLALLGGRDSDFAGYNRALDARRPIGSLAKPVVYLTALEQPGRYTLATPIDDAPLEHRLDDGRLWEPGNYDGRNHGRVPLVRALAESYNVATARLGLELGVERVMDNLRRLGVEREFEPFPSALLGAVELTPLEVAQVYQTLAAGGFRAPLRAIRSVLGRGGEPLTRYGLSVQQAVPPGPVHLLDNALQEVVRSGTARGLLRRFPESLRIAGKTGTTDDYRDSWFAGFTGDRLGVVWVGRDDNAPVGLTGAGGAMKVWSGIFGRIGADELILPAPPGVEEVAIDLASGGLAGRGCAERRVLPFLEGSAPRRRAPCARGIDQDRVGGWLQRLLPFLDR